MNISFMLDRRRLRSIENEKMRSYANKTNGGVKTNGPLKQAWMRFEIMDRLMIESIFTGP